MVINIKGNAFAYLSSRGSKDVVALVSIALLIRVEVGNDGLFDTSEGVVLNQDLGTHTAVDTGDTAIVAGGINVCGSKPNRRETGVNLLEVVVVVSDAQLASVFAGIVVGVTNEGALPLN